jgi:hypothetical protein
MEALRFILVQNQSCLGKLRARGLYCRQAITAVETDSHKQYGPFAGYWDEWLVQAEEINVELLETIGSTTIFLSELKEFIISLQYKKKLTKSDTAYLKEVTSLAQDKLVEQTELLATIDNRISLHKQLTEKLLLVEAIDNLSDD